jgi:hypothetical protein
MGFRRDLFLLAPAILLALVLAAQPAPDRPDLSKVTPRLQWSRDGGYCGETSIQTAALQYGIWVSQEEVRRLAGGEVLLGVNAGRALRRLRLAFSEWTPRGKREPRLPAFLEWLTGEVRQGHPCMIGVYIAGEDFGEYDHIVPVMGIREIGTGSAGSRPETQLFLHTLFHPQGVWRKVSGLPASRSQCRAGWAEAGDIPERTPFGLAVTGSRDAAPYPVQLRVDRADEPDPKRGQAPCGLRGTLRIGGLVKGARYIVERTDMRPRSSLQSGKRKTAKSFVASASTWEWADPDPIPSNGTTLYRCGIQP